MTDYEDFLATKLTRAPSCGFEPGPLGEHLFPFQVDITRWACRRGRAAIFADTGLGKTRMQLAWAQEVVRHTGGRVLILAPLAVGRQTSAEAETIGVSAPYRRDDGQDTGPGITITNYEMLPRFLGSTWDGVVLDESSILKSFDGKTKQAIIEAFRHTPYKLACTATPSPNDTTELGNHAEFLGVMTRAEMLAMYFFHDGGETSKWTIKGHAQGEFWKWVASWGCVVRKPSDLGYDNASYDLPPIEYFHHVVPASQEHATAAGVLFVEPVKGLNEQRKARRATLDTRVQIAIRLATECTCQATTTGASDTGPIRRSVSESSTEQRPEQLVSLQRSGVPRCETGSTEPSALRCTCDASERFVIWCELNDEQDSVAAQLGSECVSVYGSLSTFEKELRLMSFIRGEKRILLGKPSIFGWGLNLQMSARVIFVGVTHSFESYYQAIRRCWRFGQKRDVRVHVITSELEGAVLANLQRKETEAANMASELGQHMGDAVREEVGRVEAAKPDEEYNPDLARGTGWDLFNADCVEGVRGLGDACIGYTIFSPPFASLYTYSNSMRDMGNVRTHGEFYEHFRFLVPELLRVTKPGRLLSFHCMNLPTSKRRDGMIGLTDFRGLLIKMFEEAGWIFHSEVCIWKDPVTAMQRTHAFGLLHKQLKKDSCMSRQGIPDFLVTMRKPGDNPERVEHTNESFPVERWQRYASPVWMDINPNETLQRERGREDKDEKHICPLQLQVIQRGIELWSNAGDLVLSPFAGIGSEGYVALQEGRRFIGWELKRSYWELARKNLSSVELGVKKQIGLFDTVPAPDAP